jgi:hypothetical protein
VIEPSGRGGGTRVRHVGPTLQAPSDRGHRGEQRLTLGQRVMREPLGLAQLLTRTPALGRGSEALDEVLAGRQRRAARSQTGEDGAVCGPASGREFEEPVSPGAQTGHRQKAGCGASGGRRHTRQEGGLAWARDAPAGRHKPLTGRVRVVIVLAHASGSVGEIVDAGAAQPSCLHHVGGLVPSAATVCEVGSRSAQVSEATIAPVGNRCARPGRCHRDPEAADVTQRGGSAQEVRVRGVEGHNGSHRAGAQAKAESDPPEQAVAEGGLGQGHAPQPTSRLEARHREAGAPVDDGLRTRCARDAERWGQQTQDTTDRATADAASQKRCRDRYTPST